MTSEERQLVVETCMRTATHRVSAAHIQLENKDYVMAMIELQSAAEVLNEAIRCLGEGATR